MGTVSYQQRSGFSGVIADARLEGTQAVIQALKSFEEGFVENKVREALNAGAEIVAEDARARAPVGTREPRKGAGVGRLRASIKVKEAKPTKKEGEKLSAKVEADYPLNPGTRKSKTKKQAAGSKEYYAFALEYGTRSQPAQPFLAPALAANAPRIFEMMGQAMEEACREAQRSV